MPLFKRFTITLLVIIAIAVVETYAQTTITGTLQTENGDPLPGGNIILKEKLVGTTADASGNFRLTVNQSLPFSIVISSIGFAKKEIEVTESNVQNLVIVMDEKAMLGREVVISASKVEESIMASPTSVEKIGITELRNSPSSDVYGAIANLRGVQASTGSLTFTSMNTRGFADMANWRFVQLVDGVDSSPPGLNHPLGGVSGPSDIDVAAIELIPGANSALYGANAFNGLLSITTKDPFYYQGLSGYVKSGVTSQDAGGTNPLFETGFRYAKAFNDKFAFKVNFGYMTATDWTADDRSYHITNTIASSASDAEIAALLALDPNNANNLNYNAVNVQGDEVVASVDLIGDGTMTSINRTGIAEKDIVDYNVNMLKFSGSLHYRITDNIELSYGYKYINSDAIFRHTTVYPLVNFVQSFNKVELKGGNWSVKAYHSQEDAKDSYAMLGTGSFITQGLQDNNTWAADYGAAYRGEIGSVTGASHGVARAYADSQGAQVGGDTFNTLLNETLNNSDLATGGSKFIDKTSLFHVDGYYNFSQIKDIVELQLGGNYRGYNLNSEGKLFNDGPLGFNSSIKISEYGGYLQAGKKLANDRIHLRASARYDKNQNFEGRITPRVSGVFSLDTEKKHNIRTSYQTGFRNPATQETYIALDIGQAILLGGTEDNVKNYSYDTGGGIVEGQQIYDNLVTYASYLAFAGTGFSDPTVLVSADLEYVKQEKNKTFEIGYRGLLTDRFFVDLSYYNTSYEDFVVRITTLSLDVGRAFAVYTNIDDDIVTSSGLGLSLNYSLNGGYTVGGSFQYTTFNADDAVVNNPGFLPSFNTPENRLNLSLSNRDIGKSGFGFNLKFRWSDEYVWQSPFGKGTIDAFSVVDLALTKKLTKMKSILKLGANNLLGKDYNTVYGGPAVGSIYYVSLTFDQIFK